jgi:predicted nucleotidyltransferase
MTESEDILAKIRNLKPALTSWKIRRLRVFGSVLRGTANKDSDVDLIADFEQKPDLFAFIGMKQSLEEHLGRRVDLFTEQSIDRYIRQRVLEEARDV